MGGQLEQSPCVPCDRWYRFVRYDRLYPADSYDRVNSRSEVLSLVEGLLALVFILRYRSWHDVFSSRLILRNLKENRGVCLICAKLGSCKIFVDALITISSRIRTQKKYSFVFKRAFLSRVIATSKEIPICENCFRRRFRFYMVSPLNSSRCIECIRSNRFGYDIISSIATQLETLSSTYVRLEIELEDIFEKQM